MPREHADGQIAGRPTFGDESNRFLAEAGKLSRFCILEKKTWCRRRLRPLTHNASSGEEMVSPICLSLRYAARQAIRLLNRVDESKHGCNYSPQDPRKQS